MSCLAFRLFFFFLFPLPLTTFYLSHIFHDLMLFEKKLDGKKNQGSGFFFFTSIPQFFVSDLGSSPSDTKKERERDT